MRSAFARRAWKSTVCGHRLQPAPSSRNRWGACWPWRNNGGSFSGRVFRGNSVCATGGAAPGSGGSTGEAWDFGDVWSRSFCAISRTPPGSREMQAQQLPDEVIPAQDQRPESKRIGPIPVPVPTQPPATEPKPVLVPPPRRPAGGAKVTEMPGRRSGTEAKPVAVPPPRQLASEPTAPDVPAQRPRIEPKAVDVQAATATSGRAKKFQRCQRKWRLPKPRLRRSNLPNRLASSPPPMDCRQRSR